jgi:hypothetical protein
MERNELRGRIKIEIVAGIFVLAAGIATGWLSKTAITINVDTEMAKKYADLEQTNAVLISQSQVAQNEIESLRARLAEPTTTAPNNQTTTQGSIIPVPQGKALFEMLVKNEQYWQTNSGVAKDGRGALHAPKNYVVVRDSGPYNGEADYVLDNSYTTLSGTIASHLNMGSGSHTILIMVYDIVVYEATIRNTDKPLEFTCNITGADTIHIELSDSSNNSVWLLMDFIVS